MAGGAGALTAAVGVDAGHVVVDRAAHDRCAEWDLDAMRGAVVFDCRWTSGMRLSPG